MPRDATAAAQEELPTEDLGVENPANANSRHSDIDADNAPRTVNSTAQDDIGPLTAQISNLGIEAGSAAPQEDAGPVTLRAMRESGEPFDDVQFCPAERVVTHISTWYYIEDIPESAGATLTCTRCYQDYIHHTNLASQWTRIVIEEGTAVMCCFHMPRVKTVLWPEAVRSNDMYELKAFLARSKSFEACPEDTSITGVAGTTWYGLLENEIEGFSVCERCYEKYIAGTAFDVRFARFDVVVEEHTWTCHMSSQRLGLVGSYMAERDDWQGFLAAAVERLQLPTCSGEPVQSDSCGWYLARGALRDEPICATCYVDNLSITPFADRFRKYSPRIDKFPAPGVWTCSLGSMAALMVLEAALEQRNFEAFEAAMKNIVVAPPCTQDGIVDGSWWTIGGGGCPSFAICYKCFASIFWMRGMDGFLETAAAPPGERLKCSFYPSHPRFAQYWGKMTEAVDRGVFAYLGDYVRKVSHIRSCAHNGGFPNSKWWGYSDSLFCEDCYVTYVKDTAMGAHLELNGQVVAESTFCQIWSPRMRHYWEEVCAAGKPGSAESNQALEDFLGVSRYRRKTFFETLSEIEVLKQMKARQQRDALFHAQMSIQYQGIAGLDILNSRPNEYQYGSSSLGWYDSKASLESRLQFDQFQSGLLNSLLQPSDVQRILALQEIWKEFE